ncbi:molybdopterin-synthase adenylyltransferase MoeB [Halomonas sp. G11]|uniref:molybdopterin-synthase adenylyltransferase MoeB n=1 Tax=Halomonas sp. G11 TaxID=1684425 RepID=UPI000ACBF3CB|nr:molybdopterin-synthase adenylyltransferase MoeB [Halomonas sp. G11]
MVKILLPDILVNVAKLPAKAFNVEGQTVSEALTQLCREYEVLKEHLFHENERLKDHFLLTVGGELVNVDTPLNDDSRLEILLATSGGLDTPGESLSKNEFERYARHITLPEVGRQGQQWLKASRVLIIGTGGLGSPAALYLAAAGIGTLGLVDFDVVEISNLQRQVVHGVRTVGVSKVESARRRLLDINENLRVETHEVALTADNALELISDYDIVIDGSDNFATRYLVNDACVMLCKPLVYGAIYQFDGQASVLNHDSGPCYRCLFPQHPPPSLSPNCSAGGVIGVLPGMIGMIQATEAVKLLLGLGQSLSGRLLRYNALSMEFGEVRFGKRQDCPVCSANPTITELTQEANSCVSESSANPSLPSKAYVLPLDFEGLMAKDGEDIQIIDVREPNELEICKLDSSLNIPLDELEARYHELESSKALYILCLSGARAERAAQQLMQKGRDKVFVIQGGLKRWARDVDPTMPMY